MVHYVAAFSAVSSFGCCNIPGRTSLCVSMALVGFLCLAAAVALVLRSDDEPLGQIDE